MAETLRLCPFCGGEAKFETYGGTACAVVCQSCRCGTPTMSLDDGMQAVEAWNRRAERTCSVECYPPGYEDNLHYEVCSECGTILTASRPGFGHAARASYCPGCGARVTEEGE